MIFSHSLILFIPNALFCRSKIELLSLSGIRSGIGVVPDDAGQLSHMMFLDLSESLVQGSLQFLPSLQNLSKSWRRKSKNKASSNYLDVTNKVRSWSVTQLFLDCRMVNLREVFQRRLALSKTLVRDNSIVFVTQIFACFLITFGSARMDLSFKQLWSWWTFAFWTGQPLSLM